MRLRMKKPAPQQKRTPIIRRNLGDSTAMRSPEALQRPPLSGGQRPHAVAGAGV